METCLPRADASPYKSGKTAIVGLGNPSHGDDGIGPVVARHVCDLLRGKANVDLLEHAASAFSLVERLVGYQRAVIIDALTGVQAEVGTVNQVEIQEPSSCSFLSFHTAGFHDILTLARMVGLEVPSTVVMYGIAIKEPETFSENLSAELTARLPQIVKAVAAEELLEHCKPAGGT
ncbi:MAG: hydrogenase maturation protease [Terriglobia bacterium]|jgi:hydrogenase maturation protease